MASPLSHVILFMYRVVGKIWCQVVRKVQPVFSQARLAMPGWCLTKQSLFMHSAILVTNNYIIEIHCMIAGLEFYI